VNRRRRALVAWLAAAVVMTLAAAAFVRGTERPGLTMTARVVLPDGEPLDVVRPVRAVDVRDLHADPRLLRGPLVVRWAGFWNVARAGPHRIVAETDGAATVEVDGAPVVAVTGGRSRGDADLAARPHSFEVAFESRTTPRRLRLRWSGPAGTAGEFAGPWVSSGAPSSREAIRSRYAPLACGAAVAAWTLPPLGFLLLAWIRGRLSPRAIAALRLAAPALVVLLAGALRFEALVARYMWHGPSWAIAAERALSSLHPPSLRWTAAPDEEFGGDPLTYLRRARAMGNPYEANVREPLFPLAARLLLPLAGDRTWPVNAASAAFSTLLVLATYLLGAAAFSRVVGLGAALALALDRDAIWWGVEGFRDDAFAAFTVLTAAALVRMRQRPSPLRGVIAGLAGGAACLTRLSGLSFLLPALAWSALGRGPAGGPRRRAAAVSLLAALAVAAPYMAACAIEYGDPFHAVNVHTKFYRSRSGMGYDTPMSWAGYLGSAFGATELLSKGLTGLTSYPFANKWSGLDWASPWARRVLAPLAVAGLLLFARSAEGRLLLVVLFTSLLPYAFTWGVPGGAEWRFTLVAYPFYLVASLLAIERGAGLLAARVRRRRE
jgi:hypothetical protein